MDSPPSLSSTVRYNHPADPFQITRDQYLADRYAKSRGTANPSTMDKPFWKYMIARRGNAYSARELFDSPENEEGVYLEKEYENIKDPDWPVSPVWCFQRFGCTITVLPDGRYVYIGGEHEDSYDPDFAIYNADVVVISRPVASSTPKEEIDDNDGGSPTTRKAMYYDDLRYTTLEDITIYGYPLDVFPPTDFHTATYFHDQTSGEESVYIIGGLGYPYSASRDRTDVYRLDLGDFSIQKLETTGTKPSGGTANHAAELVRTDKHEASAIKITTKDKEVFLLLLKSLKWIQHACLMGGSQ